MLQYGVVIDAGSSHSQIFVYQWDGEKENGTAIARQIFSCKAKGKMFSKEPSSTITVHLWHCQGIHYLYPHFSCLPTKLQKVMFLLVSVCSQEGGPHVAISHDTLNLSVQGPPWTSDMRLYKILYSVVASTI